MMNIEVIIVGGGLSGLYAAMLLEKAGINYLLLEGRERMGGRILQANTVEADLGATWFWPTIQPALKQLFRELNIESFSHQERGDMLFERSKDAPSRHPGFVSSPAAARVSGGMSRLPDALLAKLKPERIQTGLQVKHIEQQNGTLNICGSYADGRPFSRQAQHVLLALPPMLAAGINFFPPLPTTLLQAWRNTGTWMAPHAKYVAVYPYNFWHRKGLSGEVRSNIGPMVEIHDVSEPDRMFALFGFIGVPFHERQKIGDAVLRDLCRAQLIRLLGEEAAYPHAELEAEDFRGESLITYAVPDERIDLCRKVLKPAGIPIRRKTTELTMAIIQQVACQRGIAALPIWAVSEYLEKKYVTAKSITENKLISEVWLATLTENIDKGYVNDFIGFTRQRCLRLLDEI